MSREQDAYVLILLEIRKAVESGRLEPPTSAALNDLGDIALANSLVASDRVNALCADVQAEMGIERAAT